MRLIGVYTRESRKPGVPVECGAKRATKHTVRLSFRMRSGRTVGRRVRLTTDPTQDSTDRYGRLLSYVSRRSDGKDLGRSMIQAGWARAYVYDGEAFQRLDLYSQAEARAKGAARGVWGSCGGDFHSVK